MGLESTGDVNESCSSNGLNAGSTSSDLRYILLTSRLASDWEMVSLPAESLVVMDKERRCVINGWAAG